MIQTNTLTETGRSEAIDHSLLLNRCSFSMKKTPLRPLRLLRSLFADRLDFLQQALDELESAKKERQQLVTELLQNQGKAS